MQINRLQLIYFSPTGTTRKVVEGIAAGIGATTVEHIDLTLPAAEETDTATTAGELAIIGVPVYGGRVPVQAIDRLRRLTAGRTPAVLVVVYGNREFDDALLELKHLAVDLGFLPLAGGAFIGEHSFATAAIPIASGRPDGADLDQAADFGARIRRKLAALTSLDAMADIAVPGRFPFAGGVRAMTVAPVSEEASCTVCGLCATVCPTAAITVSSRVTTEPDRCIRCCACIKNCPTGARQWADDMIAGFARRLMENCRVRKEPQFFGVEL